MVDVILIFVIPNMCHLYMKCHTKSARKLAAVGNHISKFQISSQLQGHGSVGALMGIYLEGIFTTKADIEDDIHAYRHHDISLSSWSQDQALFFTAVITP